MLRMEPPVLCERHHMGKRLAAEMRRQQAAVDDLVPFLVGNLLIRRRRIHPRPVDQAIHLPKLPQHLLLELRDRFAIVRLDAQKNRLAAERLNRGNSLGTSLLRTSSHNDRRPRLSQAITECPTEHARAADDNGDLVIEAEEVGEIVGWVHKNWGRLSAC